MRFDGMDAMTVGANWRQSVATRDRLAVDTLRELLLDFAMAFGTSRRNIELEDRRLGVASSKDFVRSVAIRADGGFVGSRRNCFSMDAFFIRQEGLGTVAARSHYEFLSVAGAARSRNVGVIDT